MQTTVGQILINSVLPKHLRDYSRVLDKKSVSDLLEKVAAENDPELYRDVVFGLHDVGRMVAHSTGSSFGIADLRTPPRTSFMRDALKTKIHQLVTDPSLTEEQRDEVIKDIVLKVGPELDKSVMDEFGTAKNPFHEQATSGARGSKSEIRALVSGDLLVTDHKSRIIPMPIMNSYAHGIDPVEYWAAAYGSRVGGLSTKLCLAAGTQVLLAPGYMVKTIEELRVGDSVYTVDDAGKLIVTAVTAVSYIGERACNLYSFGLGAGRTTLDVMATPEHKIFAKWRERGIKGSYKKSMIPLESVRKGRKSAVLSCGINKMLAVCPCVSKKMIKLRAALTVVRARTPNFMARYRGTHAVGFKPVYDIEVAHPLHRFVLANGLIVSNSTQQAGFFAKQLVNAAHRQVVTAHDCGTSRGIPVASDDRDNIGAVLQEDAAGFKAGTPIDVRIHKVLASKLPDTNIMVRSALTCEAADGICAKCAGIRERGRYPEIGDNLGVAAAQALAERLSQGALNKKHSGGRATKAESEAPTGFKLINQLVQVPKSFAGAAAVSKTDGVIHEITDAPQGGKHVLVGDVSHWVPAGLDVKVKVGDRVEEGSVLSEGIPNPSELVTHKGLGAGRLDFVHLMRQAYRDSGLTAHRRNIEVLTRGLLNHVEVTDLDGVDNALPDDIVEYSAIERNYRPRYGFKVARPAAVVGHYLEKPARQYTIGTRITKNVAADLNKAGIHEITAHQDPPPFRPKMVRAMEQSSIAPDWQVRLGGSYQERGLLDALHKGVPSNISSTSYIPALVRGKGFGEKLEETGKY